MKHTNAFAIDLIRLIRDNRSITPSDIEALINYHIKDQLHLVVNIKTSSLNAIDADMRLEAAALKFGLPLSHYRALINP